MNRGHLRFNFDFGQLKYSDAEVATAPAVWEKQTTFEFGLGSTCSATSRRISNLRPVQYSRVNAALSTISAFPEGHPLYVEKDAIDRTCSLLAVIEQSLSIEAPQIFTDEEGITLKWRDDVTEKYLSVTRDDSTLLEKSAHGPWKCVHDLEGEGEVSLERVFLLLAQPNANTASEV